MIFFENNKVKNMKSKEDQCFYVPNDKSTKCDNKFNLILYRNFVRVFDILYYFLNTMKTYFLPKLIKI